MRIVSLLPSATEIVYALGLQEHLVSISHECDHPPEALHLPPIPTVGPQRAAVTTSVTARGSAHRVRRTPTGPQPSSRATAAARTAR